ncbi:MAG TPA: NAD(+) diphosphatase [Thermoanaerobaculia bacterium]|nr:NAD(+) diphosphatase [Thermoanaerobaculia bacterium]
MTFDRRSEERNAPPSEGVTLVTDGERFRLEGTRLAREPFAGEALFLGRDDGTPLFLAVDANAAVTHTFREAAAVLERDEVSLLSYAQGMLTWAKRTRFCSVCAQELESRQAGYSRACPQCGAEFYPRLDPAVMIMATHRDRILLAQHRGRASVFWSTLAGFVEPGETLEEAVARELKEEAGLTATAIRYFGSQPWPLPASLMIGFEVDVEDDAITIDPAELLDARFFAREELEAITRASNVSLAGWMIGAWQRR